MTIQRLAHDAHLVPIVRKFPAAFQANYIVAGGGADGLPGRADGAGAAGGRSRSKRLRDFPVAAGDGEELEKFFDHSRYSGTKKLVETPRGRVSTPKNKKKPRPCPSN